jgi:hypothetical protein
MNDRPKQRYRYKQVDRLEMSEMIQSRASYQAQQSAATRAGAKIDRSTDGTGRAEELIST